MEPDNSQFSEVPSEEATGAASEAPRLRKSRAELPPEGWTGVEAKPETTIDPSLGAGGGAVPFAPNDFKWQKEMDRRGGAASIAAAERAASAYQRNKAKLGVYTDLDGDEGTEGVGEPSSIDAETAHYGGGHGLQGIATAEEMADLPTSHRVGMFAHADECESCRQNVNTYVNDVLPGQHENGQHRPTDARKNPAENLDPYCPGCIADLDSKVNKHGNHSRYPAIFRILFRNKGCAACGQNIQAQVAQEHMLGHHSGGVENRHPSCGECSALNDADEAAAAKAAADAGSVFQQNKVRQQQHRRNQLLKINIHNRYPRLSEEEKAAGVTQQLVSGPGSDNTLITRVPGGLPKWERVPGPLHPVVSSAVVKTLMTNVRRNRYRQAREAMQTQLVAMDRREAQQAAEAPALRTEIPGPPERGSSTPVTGRPTDYSEFLRPKGIRPTETEAGTTVSEAELAEYHGDPESGIPGIKESIPTHLRHLWENPEVIPTRSQRREAEAAAKEARDQRVQQDTDRAQATQDRYAAMDQQARARDTMPKPVTSTYTGPVVRGRGPVPSRETEALNCSGCGKMISPVRGAADPVTGEAPQELCRNCQREAKVPLIAPFNSSRVINSPVNISEQGTVEPSARPSTARSWGNSFGEWLKNRDNTDRLGNE